VGPRAKVRHNGATGSEKALGVPDRLERLRASFPLARRLMQVLRTIVEIAVLLTFHALDGLITGSLSMRRVCHMKWEPGRWASSHANSRQAVCVQRGRRPRRHGRLL
jgi:hypothetical protein